VTAERNTQPTTNGRRETANERSDRNWNEILQELRVTQTGTQILTGFLVTLAFQQRFTTLDQYQLVLYLVLVSLSAATTALGLAPVSLHRLLFHRGVKGRIVSFGDLILRMVLLAVAILVAGVVLFIFDVVVGRAAGIIAGLVTAVGILLIWVTVPSRLRMQGAQPAESRKRQVGEETEP
jgi:hypothetical protein